jgi:hypothetical protein
VLPPIEKLLAQLSREELRAEVRANLVAMQKAEQAASQEASQGLSARLARLERRLQGFTEMRADYELSREEYAKLRAEYEPQINELKAQLAARPHLALPDVEQLFAIADAIASDVVTNWDQQSWREMLEAVVERVIIEGHDIRVEWKPEFASLLSVLNPG